MQPTTTNPIDLAHQYAEAAIYAEMRPGTANQYDCPISTDKRVTRLSELYASRVLGALGPQSRQEMLDLEASLTNGL